jgi:glycosyltransferase involved in cell wall biosynthesis
MRVLHVIESMGRGGAERNLASLLGPLAALGVENHLVTFWPGRSYEDRVAPFLATRHDLGLPPGKAVRALPRLVRLARTVDLVHTQLTWANLLGRLAAIAAGRPSVTTLHTTLYDESNLARLPSVTRRKVRVIRWLDGATARTTRHFFAVSPAVKEVQQRALGVPEERIELAPCCIDVEDFNPQRLGDRAAARVQVGFAAGEFALLSVGRLIWSKRHEDAILAIAEIARMVPARLYIAGAGPDEPALRALAERLSAPVSFLGVRDDVPLLLHAADAFIFPSVYEGMPLALLEAMAMGCPCLCSDIVENRNLGGATVSYFPPTDVKAIVSALRATIGDPVGREQLGGAARVAALRFADPQAAAARFVRAVRPLVPTATAAASVTS